MFKINKHILMCYLHVEQKSHHPNDKPWKTLDLTESEVFSPAKFDMNSAQTNNFFWPKC